MNDPMRLIDITEQAVEDQEMYASTIEEVIETCHKIALEHGFWDSTNFGEKIALIHSELSEALEARRHNDPMDEHLPDRKNTEVELADAVIRIFDLAAYEGYDLAGAIIAKMNFNKTRPAKHGKQF